MKAVALSGISNEELLQKIKALKNNKIMNAFIVGLTAGIFCYSTVKNGFGIVSCFPLIIGYLVIKNSSVNADLERELLKELESRDVK